LACISGYQKTKPISLLTNREGYVTLLLESQVQLSTSSAYDLIRQLNITQAEFLRCQIVVTENKMGAAIDVPDQLKDKILNSAKEQNGKLYTLQVATTLPPVAFNSFNKVDMGIGAKSTAKAYKYSNESQNRIGNRKHFDSDHNKSDHRQYVDHRNRQNAYGRY